MIKKLPQVVCALLCLCLSMPLLNAQSVELAKDYYQHGLNDPCKGYPRFEDAVHKLAC